MRQRSTDATSWRAPHFGFGAQSELAVAPDWMVAPLTLPPIAMPLQSAWTLTDAGFSTLRDAGLEAFASGDFWEGARWPKPPQTPVPAPPTPPPTLRHPWLRPARARPDRP